MKERIIKEVGDFIFVADAPQPVDVIFIPGGSHPALPEYAARLYQQGLAPILLPAGGVSIKTGFFPGVKENPGTYQEKYASEWGFYQDVLLKNGVPQAAILKEDQSRYTKENALFSCKVLAAQGIVVKRAIICCKSFHARRCLMLYSIAFPEVEILVCPVDVYGVTQATWWQTSDGRKRVLGELARCGQQTEELFS